MVITKLQLFSFQAGRFIYKKIQFYRKILRIPFPENLNNDDILRKMRRKIAIDKHCQCLEQETVENNNHSDPEGSLHIKRISLNWADLLDKCTTIFIFLFKSACRFCLSCRLNRTRRFMPLGQYHSVNISIINRYQNLFDYSIYF